MAGALAGDQVAQTAPILLCPTPARFHLRRLLEPFLPKVVVLSRWKFLSWFQCNRQARRDEEMLMAIRVSRWSLVVGRWSLGALDATQ